MTSYCTPKNVRQFHIAQEFENVDTVPSRADFSWPTATSGDRRHDSGCRFKHTHECICMLNVNYTYAFLSQLRTHSQYMANFMSVCFATWTKMQFAVSQTAQLFEVYLRTAEELTRMRTLPPPPVVCCSNQCPTTPLHISCVLWGKSVALRHSRAAP